MDQLVINEKVGANYMLYEMNGAVNAYTISEIQEKISTLIPDSNIVLDMSGVTQLDSSGVGMILAGHNDGEDFGTRLFIMNPSEETRHSLNKTGFLDSFNIIHSVTEVADAS